MATTITNPTIKNTNNRNEQLGLLPLRADETSAKKYLEDNNLGTFASLTSNGEKFSNDYGGGYNYYVSGETYITYWLNTGITYEWRTEFGYYPTIESITYS